MLFLAGFVLIAAALCLVVVARRAARRPDAPHWLRASVLGNAVALVATTLLGSGAGLLLQAAASRGDMIGAAWAATALVLPFVGLWLLALRRHAAGAETAAQPSVAEGPSRRGRPGDRPAPGSGASAAARKAG